VLASLALLPVFASAGLALAFSPAAGAAVASPLVSTATSESTGSVVGDASVLSVTFNEPPVLAGSYSLTLTDGSNVGTLSSASGNVSATVSGNTIAFTVHGGPLMSAGSSLSLSVLEILAATGVSDGNGNPWDLVASGQVDKVDSSNACLSVAGYTRVFGGSNCAIGFGHPGPTTPDVYDVIPLRTADLPGPPNDNAPEVITACEAGSTDVVYDVNTGAELGTKACGVATNPPESLIGNTNSNTLDYIATANLVSFQEVGVVETIPGSNYISAAAVPPQLRAITITSRQATFTYYGDVVCQASSRSPHTISQFSYETPSTNLDRSGLVYASAVSCPPSNGGSSLIVTYPRPLTPGSSVRFKYAGYGSGHYVVGASGSLFALERAPSESAFARVPATAPAAGEGPHRAAPNTRLLTEDVSSSGHSARFGFAATGDWTGFQCALVHTVTTGGATVPSLAYSSCSSPKTFSNLDAGSYVLYVRALGPGGADKTPATYSFTIS
jgi:hypothetical protein